MAQILVSRFSEAYKYLWKTYLFGRVDMRLELLCPACGIREFDFDDFESLVLLSPNLALVQFICPGCGISLSATLKLTPEMQRKLQQRQAQGKSVSFASDKGGSVNEMPDPSLLSYSANLVVEEDIWYRDFANQPYAGSPEAKAHLEYFKRQLEVIETVDDAIEEIDTGYYHEKRDA
jgi:predicted RNA-binding Zn-ribbon protein involved in translation (DUF1610 family)